MLDSVRGIVLEAGLEAAVLEVGGLALRLKVPPGSCRGLRVGDEARLFAHLMLREEQFHLYGFVDAEVREAFSVLLGVSGLGPEKARGLLGALQPAEIARAVAEGDSRRFQVVKGIGTRLAQRLALELKGKVDGFLHGAPSDPRGRGPSSAARGDLVAALSQLGFPRVQAEQAARAATDETPDASMEDLLRAALRVLQGPA